jgi:hypothetical protein
VNSSGEVDITKLLSLLCRCNKALIWLPFSCYLVAGKMAKVESNNISAMPLLSIAAKSVRKWIAVVHDSVNGPTSSLGSFAMLDSRSTNFGDAQ